MKKFVRISMILFVLLVSFFFCDAFFAKAIDNNDMSSFLEFEQAIIDLNNEDNKSKNNQSMLLSYGRNNFSDEEDGEFSLKRLIVQGNLKKTYGASNVISYNNLHVLCYDSQKDTEYAYEKLLLDSSLDVFVDKIHKLEEYAEKDYDYSSYKNWGAQAIDIGGYREFLLDNNVTKEVVVVVMDTGINTSHPMFTNRLLTDKYGKIKGYSYYDSGYKYSYNNLSFDVDDPSTVGIDEGDDNKYSFEDDHGHGAHVAGIITSLTPQNVKILPIKIGNSKGRSSDTIFLSAYLRIINIYSKQYNIVSTNLSFSGAGKDNEKARDTFNEQCYNPLLELNILPITAAGNESDENNIEGLNAIVVSSLAKKDNMYTFDKSYSNYGRIVDISAPGTNIVSAGIALTDGADSSYVSKTGTSMASPQVAGVVALLYLNPNLPNNFKVSDIEKMLYDLSLDLGMPSKDIYYGVGILNMKYFESTKEGELSFYKDGKLIDYYVDNENFSNAFTLEIKSSNPNFKILYTIDKTIPTFSKSLEYKSSIYVSASTTIYAIGVKIINGRIIERTNLYNISYFNKNTPIEDCFTITDDGRLGNYTGNYTNLVIPSVIRGTIVKSLEPSIFKDSNIESITLPSTVTEVGGYAFLNAKNLKYVYAPGVTKLFINAFGNCDSLKFVKDVHPTSNDTEGAYLPNLKETIGSSFSDCENLESVSLSKLTTMGSNGYDFYNCSKLSYIYLPLINSISKGAFYNCVNLKGEFVISQYIETVGVSAFRNTGIRTFKVDKNNKYFYTDGLGLYSNSTFVAFATVNENIDYTILSSVTINGTRYTVTTIGESAATLANFNNLTIPGSITLINRFAFSDSTIDTLYYNAKNCSHSGYFDKESYFRADVFYKIGTIEIGANVENIPERLFQKVYFDELIINSYYTNFSSSSFYRMEEQGVLNKVVLNFTNSVSNSYIKMLFEETSILTYSDLNYIFSKTEININASSKLNQLKYKYLKDGYIVYSREPLVNTYTITATSNGYGSVSPEGSSIVSDGASITYFFTPNLGYYIKSISIDGAPLNGSELTDALSQKCYTFTDVNRNHIINVVFAPSSYNIIYKDSDGNILMGLAPNSYLYGVGATLPINVVKKGYNFVGWYEYSDFRGEKITSILKSDLGDKAYYAKFEIAFYTISVIQKSNGVISEPLEKYEYGSSAYFTIQANNGYYIEYLIIDGVKQQPSVLHTYVFTNISSNRTISAIFKPNTDNKYKVRHWQQSLNGENSTSIDDKYYILVKTDEYFNGVTDASTNVVPYSYTGFEALEVNQKIILWDGSTVVDVLYDRSSYSVSIIKSEGVKTVDGSGKYLYGQEVTISAVVDEGYTWDFWESSISSIVPNSKNIEYTFIMPASSITFRAVLETFKHTITMISERDGVSDGSSVVKVEHGEDKAFVFLLNEGYEITDILIDNVALKEEDLLNAINEGYIFENVNANHIMKVVYTKLKYIIRSSFEGNGNITPNGDVVVEHGDNMVFNFNCDEDSYIKEVLVNGFSVGPSDSYEFNNVTRNYSIKVIFEKKILKVNVSYTGKGTIESESDLKNIQYGGNVLINIIAENGYKISRVLVDSIPVEIIDGVLEINDIKSNIDVEIEFEKMEDIQKGLSCSKGSEGEGNITDFLFVIFSFAFFVFMKKKFTFKI